MNFLVFDFDGTLCNSIAHFLPAINSLSEKYGFMPVRDDDHLEVLKNKSSHEIFRELQFDLVKLPFVVSDLRRMMSENIDQVELYDKIADQLADLSRSVAEMAILSSNSAANIEYVLRKHNLLDHFTEISGRSLFFGKSRKMKQIKQALLKKHGAKAEQCRFLYIGDETKDIEAAKEAGYEAVAVAWGIQKEGILKEFSPHLLIRESQDLSKELLAYLA